VAAAVVVVAASTAAALAAPTVGRPMAVGTVTVADTATVAASMAGRSAGPAAPLGDPAAIHPRHAVSPLEEAGRLRAEAAAAAWPHLAEPALPTANGTPSAAPTPQPDQPSAHALQPSPRLAAPPSQARPGVAATAGAVATVGVVGDGADAGDADLASAGASGILFGIGPHTATTTRGGATTIPLPTSMATSPRGYTRSHAAHFGVVRPPNRTLSISRVLPTTAAIATSAPPATVSTESSVSGSTISK